MSIQLVTRARSAGVLITPREVFERKTVAALSETAGTAGNRAVVDELPGGGVGEIELTPIVEWMLDRGGDFRRYSQSVLLSVPATLDQVTLTLAMQAVLDHHDILRAGIRATHHPESARRMDVAPVGTVRAETVVRHVSLGGSAAETVSTELDAALGRLDPEAGVMVQAVLLDTDGADSKGPAEPETVATGSAPSGDGRCFLANPDPRSCTCLCAGAVRRRPVTCSGRNLDASMGTWPRRRRARAGSGR